MAVDKVATVVYFLFAYKLKLDLDIFENILVT